MIKGMIFDLVLKYGKYLMEIVRHLPFDSCVVDVVYEEWFSKTLVREHLSLGELVHPYFNQHQAHAPNHSTNSG